MPLAVRKVFSTMQGEGSRAGSPVVFIRLAGCNLWSGLESGRADGVGVCARWCDTEFAQGERQDVEQIVARVLELTTGWPAPAVVISGGEPCLQLRKPDGERLVQQLTGHAVHVAVETNGTVLAPILSECDHITVSPKGMANPVGDPLAHVLVRTGTDLKVVHPQWQPEQLWLMDQWNFDHRYLQPLDTGGSMVRSAQETLEAARAIGWKVSIQLHKLVEME
jgi:organic radical activating enzyme